DVVGGTGCEWNDRRNRAVGPVTLCTGRLDEGDQQGAGDAADASGWHADPPLGCMSGRADFEYGPLGDARVSSIGVPVWGAIRLPVTFSPGVHRLAPALDFASTRCHDARDEFPAALLHMVERLDLRHAGLDQPLWRVRR